MPIFPQGNFRRAGDFFLAHHHGFLAMGPRAMSGADVRRRATAAALHLREDAVLEVRHVPPQGGVTQNQYMEFRLTMSDVNADSERNPHPPGILIPQRPTS